MARVELSIIVRCSEDQRVFACLDSIDIACDVVVALTPSSTIEELIANRGLPYAVTPKGNPAATTIAALPYCKYPVVLLVDSDCVFLPGAISRLLEAAQAADIVRPCIHFATDSFSSRCTSAARHFQYTYCGFVYEPGLLLNLNRVLPKVDGYLFSPFAPYTPDGELDYRIRRRRDIMIATDEAVTLVHASLSFGRHLYSYWRYGYSEAVRMRKLRQPVLKRVVAGLPLRYRQLCSGNYPLLTLPAILLSDIVYFTSMVFNGLRRGEALIKKTTSPGIPQSRFEPNAAQWNDVRE